MTPLVAYPRIPYLANHVDAGANDAILDAKGALAALAAAERIEEKLDGANVMIWWDDDGPRVASRGGAGAMDRAGQLGPLRAWASKHRDAIRALASDGTVIFGEWLWFVHSLSYDALPDFLVVLDLWSPYGGWLAASNRDEACSAWALTVPPVVALGPVTSFAALSALTDRSSWRSGPMEGVVVRARHEPRLSKWVRPDFRRFTDWPVPHTRNVVLSPHQNHRPRQDPDDQ